MTYQPRIHADPTYLQALGRAFYNFTYLEWVVIWIIVKLSSDGFSSVPSGKGATAGRIANALTKAIHDTSPPLPSDLRYRLVEVDKAYRDAIGYRNKLLHAHPYTADDGAQQLLYTGGPKWPLETVHEAAKLFEDAAIMGNAIFHGDLAQVRP